MGDQEKGQEGGYRDTDDRGIDAAEDEGLDEEGKGRVGDQEQGHKGRYRDTDDRGIDGADDEGLVEEVEERGWATRSKDRKVGMEIPKIGILMQG
jgi:hypothetical protein